MNITGRIQSIKKKKHNIFVICKNNELYQLLLKPSQDVIFDCNSINVGDIVECEVVPDQNNSSKFKCPYPSYIAKTLNIVSKRTKTLDKLDVQAIIEYSSAKKRVIDLLDKKSYIQVTLPILTDGETSSKADSYLTMHQYYDKTLYLRKSMDSFLRILSCHDINKIYSIGKLFRNGHVTAYNQSEFEMLSVFSNYTSRAEAMDLAVDIVKEILCDKMPEVESVIYSPSEDYNCENKIFVVSGYPNTTNSYAALDENGNADEFRIKYKGVTIVHGVKEISSLDEYKRKIRHQGKKQNYGELINLERAFKNGAPPCYNVGISIVRILALESNKKIKNYEPFPFSRLEKNYT